MATTLGGLALPYPTGTDLVINGDDDIEALATTVEDRIKPTYLQVTMNGPEVLTASGCDLTFPLPSVTQGFSRPGAADDIVYTGPTRWHMVHAYLTAYSGSGGDLTLALRRNAVTERSALAPGIPGGKPHTVAITMLLLLNSGDVLGMNTTASVDHGWVWGGLDIMAIAPVLP